MSKRSLVLQSLRFYWRQHASVFAGMGLAAAVLTGALIMGDSVRYSLQRIALARLGHVEHALYQPNRFVDERLVNGLSGHIGAQVAALLQLRGMAVCQNPNTGESAQVNQVQVLGVDGRFWPLAAYRNPDLGEQEVALNEKLAHALGVQAGDTVSLRVMRPSPMALDAPLSPRSEDQLSRTLLSVKHVLPDNSAGRFSLIANQIAPYNAFVDLDTLRRQTRMEERANTILVGGGVSPQSLAAATRQIWTPENIGLRLRKHASGAAQLESDRVFLEEAVTEAALAIPGASGTLAYLVNSIAKGDVSTPYSFAVAGPVPDTLKDDEALVNQWLADQLDLSVGDPIAVAYYEVTPSNAFVERTRPFIVRGIQPVESWAIERDLMPEFPGLSDVESCKDWSIGMPMDEEALRDPANEAYWQAYRQTPKILVTLKAGQAMWANRFGRFTAIRFKGGADRIGTIRAAIQDDVKPADVGLGFTPVREQAERSVEQSMDFGGLFLGMSFFLIVAALVLTGLLFVFGVQQRSGELGALLVMGFRSGQIRRLLLAEAVVVALAASAAGALGGTLYARVLLLGLSRFWEGAVANTALQYHTQPRTLLTGGVVAFCCALAAVALAAWRQTRKPASTLLAADSSLEGTRLRPGRARYLVLLTPPVGGAGLGIAGSLYVLASAPANMALPFFGIGALLLVSGLAFWRVALIALGTAETPAHWTLRKLAVQQVARRPGRSMAVAGLLACGVFLVLSVASMREDLASHAGEPWSGTGGFELFAQTTVPVQESLAEAIGAPDVIVIPVRVRDGDDASCLNLNHSRAPRLLGVDPAALAALGAFDRARGQASIWRLLERKLPDGAIPALVGDTDTAMWGLKAKAEPEDGAVLTYRDELGKEVSVKLMGCLPMRLSVFQGSILVPEAAFTRLYPSESGFRTFLIDVPAQRQEELAATLQKTFERSGMDVVPALERLREFYTVESTYLGMFLVLGGMGVTLGGIGMGIVMLRNLLERRGELAMLGVVGYSRHTLLRVLLFEHAALLLAGTGIGAGAATVAMLPSVIASASQLPLGLQAAILLLVMLSGAGSMTLALLFGRPGDHLDALRNE